MRPLEGWYPDPKAPIPLRYWDGEYWTSRIRTTSQSNDDIVEEGKDAPNPPLGRVLPPPRDSYSSANPQRDVISIAAGWAIGLYLGIIFVDGTFDTNHTWSDTDLNRLTSFFFFGYFVSGVLVAIGMHNYPRDMPKSIFFKIKVGLFYVAVLAAFYLILSHK